MKFVLEIELGNDEMKDGVDLAEKLHEIANRVGDVFGIGSVHVHHGDVFKIKDDNGNTVGKWEIK